MARCSPSDKFELVRLLKSLGEVVAVTGDGTNDAPVYLSLILGFKRGRYWIFDGNFRDSDCNERF